MSDWRAETLHADFAFSLRAERVLHEAGGGAQSLCVFDNPVFGRVLMIDGAIQTTERDEFVYHEMLVHVPLLAHGGAERVLIVGGGDGGAAREVLRHAGIREVTLVEIDAGVVETARRYLPTLSAGAFDDPRLRLEIADGAAYLQATEQRFDVIVVDSTDPVGPGEALFTPEFYAAARRCLAAGGVMVTQNGVPFLQGTALRATMRAFRSLFRESGCYLATVPSYGGGPMAFGWGSDGPPAEQSVATLRARMERAGLSPRYYTPETHVAAFALPGYVQDMAA